MKIDSRIILLPIIFFFLSAFCPAQTKTPVPSAILEEQLTVASRIGDVETVKKLLALGVSAKTRDRFDQPAILLAVRGDQWSGDKAFQIIDLLLKHGADINDKNIFGTTPLMITQNISKFGSNDDFFIKRGADVKAKDKFGGTLADFPYFGTDPKYPHYAEEKDKVTLDEREAYWRFALEGGFAKLGAKGNEFSRLPNGLTVMMALVYYGDNYALDLLSREENFKMRDENGDSTLFYAVLGDCFRCLFGIEDKAFVNQPNKAGETALIRAARYDRDFIALRLLQKGADPNIRDKTGKTALFYAAEFDYSNIIVNLIAGGANPNLRNSDDLTPLMIAAKAGNKMAVTAFIFAKKMARQAKLEARKSKKKADLNLAQRLAQIDLNAKNSKGETALSLARENGHREIVKLLQSP
jgi:ankyrin repeat protein